MPRLAIGQRLAGAIVAAALLATGGCSEVAGGETASEDIQTDLTRSLISVLADMPDHATLNRAISTADIGPVFDGAASYTLLAPTDAAFAKLGRVGETLMEREQRPILLGMVRAHMLPGHVTPASIEQAIADRGGPVAMATLAGGDVTFARADDGGIEVTDAAGAKAAFTGSAVAAANGVIIPLDTVLLPE